MEGRSTPGRRKFAITSTADRLSDSGDLTRVARPPRGRGGANAGRDRRRRGEGTNTRVACARERKVRACRLRVRHYGNSRCEGMCCFSGGRWRTVAACIDDLPLTKENHPVQDAKTGCSIRVEFYSDPPFSNFFNRSGQNDSLLVRYTAMRGRNYIMD